MMREQDRLAGVSLTAREQEVLLSIGAKSGLTDQQIAKRLWISIHTVHRHIERLTAKTGLHGRVRLAMFAASLGLGQPASQYA
ncbi:MAG TPA: helix-turn-helix transcriptional regulator [Chloroflexota bacterium]|nr:helix-turn-helix transcriptional regulator [Chloroflexota bacterium]